MSTPSNFITAITNFTTAITNFITAIMAPTIIPTQSSRISPPTSSPGPTKRSPPPPAPISSSASKAQPEIIPLEETDLEAKDSTITGAFDKKKERALVYLSTEAIVMAGIQKRVELKEGWFNAKKIHILVVDCIQNLETPKPPKTKAAQAAFVLDPSAQMSLLKSIVTSTRGALESALEYFDERSNEPAFSPDLGDRFFLRENMKWSLLHGTQCELRKNEILIASGKLQFYKFWGFSIGQGAEKKVFSIYKEDVVSGWYHIEKVKAVEEGFEKANAEEEGFEKVDNI